MTSGDPGELPIGFDDTGPPKLVLPPPDESPRIETLVQELSRLLVRHPLAAQAIFAALVAEGRRFARTEEGRRWQAALANSELVRRGRALWEGSILNFLEDDPDTIIPSSFFDAFVRAASRGRQNAVQISR